MIDSFFITGNLPENIDVGAYSIPLALFSYVVAVMGSYSAILLTDLMSRAELKESRQIYQIGASIALGVGIWSMHFIGMLAYHTHMVIDYDPLLTFLSMILAIGVAAVAIHLVGRKDHSVGHSIAAAIILGLSVATMHYTGMAAMKMDALLRYIPGLFFLSIMIAIAASGAAVFILTWLARNKSEHKKFFQIIAAAVMGVAIAGMHYTGMAASVFIPFADCRYDPDQSHTFLISFVVAATAAIVWSTFALSFYRNPQDGSNMKEKIVPLMGRMGLSFSAVLLLLIIGLWFFGRLASEHEMGHLFSEKRQIIAQSIFQAIERDLVRVEAAAYAISANVEDAEDLEKSIKDQSLMLTHYVAAQDYISGGGFWPEPKTLKEKKGNAGFSWDRQSDGSFKIHSHDNGSPDRDYHNYEWYAPVRYMPPHQCYWSKPRVDPFLLQPVITCSVGIWHHNRNFSGIVTIDVKLDKLNILLKEMARALGGGILLLLDRDNQFIAFPDLERVQRDHLNFMTAGEFASKNLWFVKIRDSVEQISALLKDQIKNDKEWTEIARIIDEQSSKIDTEESKSIAAILYEKQKNGVDPAILDSILQMTRERTEIPQGTFFDETSLVDIFFDSGNNWKLVVISSKSAVLKEIEKVSNALIFPTLIVSALLFGAFFLLVRRWVITPLQDISTRLIDQKTNGVRLENFLNENLNNEIGLIARLFNERTKVLEDAVNQAYMASRTKSEFLANMSHEIRTPLNSILGMIQIVLQEPIPDSVSEMLKTMGESSYTLLRIVNDILDISKIESGEMRLEYTGFYLNQSLTNTIQPLLPLASAKGLVLSYKLPEKDCFVLGDPLLVGRIMTNLVGNAIRYTDKGQITVDATVSEFGKNRIIFRCSIRDTGIGIPKNKLGVIFEKFVQADASSTRKYGGTGLGLAITRELVEIMEGKIWVESELGVGSVFWIEIPFESFEPLEEQKEIRYAQKEHEKSLTKVSPNQKSVQDVRILVAEDHLMNQQFLRRLFKNLGITNYKIVENGEEVIAELKASSYDLILMDCHMPIKDGYKATQEIRALLDPEKSMIPIIAMTANAMREDEEKCLQAGMDAYIGKPVVIEIFKRKLMPWVLFQS